MDTRPQHPSPLSRREVLKILGVIGGSSLLAACAPTVATPTAAVPATPVPATKVPATTAPTTVPTQGPVTGKVVVMRHPEEFTDAEMQPLLEQEPGLQIEYVEADATRFFAMYAAGTPPDMLRTQAPAIPQYLARNMLYDLTPYFEVSDLLKPDDLAPANNYYRANSPLEIGEGRIYGMTKDWSPDFTLFAYRKAFEDAGVDLPDDSTPLTYQQVNDLAHNLAKFEGDRVAVWGYGYGDWWSDRIWMNMLGELGKSLYSEDFTQISLSQDEDAKAIMKFYFDLAKENLVASPLNPSPSWNGEDFTKGTVAILQYGYWYSASAESDITKDQVVMLPAPTWAGKRRDPTITATGYIMAAATKVPDATWKVFEWV